jgi:hypothetical protein
MRYEMRRRRDTEGKMVVVTKMVTKNQNPKGAEALNL